METQSETKFEFTPRNNYVIVKATTKVSRLVLTGTKATDADLKEEVEFVIEAIGETVKGLTKGDSVVMNSAPDLILNVKSNNRSRKALGEFYASYTGDKKSWEKVEVIEYLLVPEYAIVAIRNK